ncbi:unnamed protein product, partial [Linum tenue]
MVEEVDLVSYILSTSKSIDSLTVLPCHLYPYSWLSSLH